MDELLADFLAETAENLAMLDEALLKLERSPGHGATLAEVFRLVHTIKGTCGFLDLPRLDRVAHAAEDLLGALRELKRLATPALISLVLAAIDRIKEIVAATAATGAEPPGHDEDLLAVMRAALVMLASGRPSLATPLSELGCDGVMGLAAQNIRVNVATIETLMNLVSELVLNRNQLLQIARTSTDTRFEAPLQRLSKLTSDLQEGVMKTRMQPIRHAWNTFPRMVRDLAAELGKQIDLEMSGEDTELDRHVLELIRAPLAHMVRNCADHGLEPPAIRVAAGKPARGTIRLNSFHEGGTIVIEIADDGAGLPTTRIQERAIARQLASAAELADWGERQVNRLIFMPGFSTADAVTAVSGRGVGLDIAQTNVERLGGSVDVGSTPGLGTTFTVRIPLTLAIVPALALEAGGQSFALPQSCIVEVVQLDPSSAEPERRLAVEHVDGTPMLCLRHKLLPLVSLAKLLGLQAAPPSRVMTIVVAQLGGLLAGLVVDRVFDTEEIVVKPASRLLRHIPLFSGSTVLGDGAVIMILDPSGLSRAIGHGSGVRPHQIAAPVPLIAAGASAPAAMLLVRLAAGARSVAVSLGLVARIESIPREAVQQTPDNAVTPYRGQLMPLLMPAGHCETDPMPVLIFSDRDRAIGLVVAEIIDVVEETLTIELASQRPGLLGTAMISGQATDVLDTAYWLTQGRQDWFVNDRTNGTGSKSRLLVVEESPFLRELLVPGLSASGYHVTAVDSATKALALRDAEEPAFFDAIISDVEIPGADGLQFAARLREGGRWLSTPLLALSGYRDSAGAGRNGGAGFDEYIGKFDRAALLAALQRQLSPADRTAA